jgi:glucosamine kinase
LPLSDEGSSAWLGDQALRRGLRAHDGMAWSPLLTAARPVRAGSHTGSSVGSPTQCQRDFGSLAPTVVDHAEWGHTVAGEFMRLAAVHIDKLAARMVAMGPDGWP